MIGPMMEPCVEHYIQKLMPFVLKLSTFQLKNLGSFGLYCGDLGSISQQFDYFFEEKEKILKTKTEKVDFFL